MYRELSIPGYAIVRRYELVSSTMDVARGLIAESAISSHWRALVMADAQSAGRGRQGRSWVSAERAFMGTFVYHTRQPLGSLAGYSLAVGVAVAEALEHFGCGCSLKWPNDLVVVSSGSFRKLGGILIEVEDLGEHRAVLIGLGINISRPPSDLSEIALCVEDLTQTEVPVDAVAKVLAESLARIHDAFESGEGFAVFRQTWEKRSCFIPGKTAVSVDVGNEHVSGVYLGVSDSGALRLRANGVERVVFSGHITGLELCP